MAAVTQIRHRHSRRPRLLRPQDRRRPHRQRSDPRAQTADQRRHLHPPPRRRRPGRATDARRAREGNRGTTLKPARPAHTPNTGSSDKPLPDPPPPYDRPTHRRPPLEAERTLARQSEKPLDKQRGLDRCGSVAARRSAAESSDLAGMARLRTSVHDRDAARWDGRARCRRRACHPREPLDLPEVRRDGGDGSPRGRTNMRTCRAIQPAYGVVGSPVVPGRAV